ncbi:hypothetical protein [Dongia sp. agr-C8]
MVRSPLILLGLGIIFMLVWPAHRYDPVRDPGRRCIEVPKPNSRAEYLMHWGGPDVPWCPRDAKEP